MGYIVTWEGQAINISYVPQSWVKDTVLWTSTTKKRTVCPSLPWLFPSRKDAWEVRLMMGSSTSLLKRFNFGTICRKIHRLKKKHYWKQLWYWWKICKRVLRALWLKCTAIKTSKLSRVNQKNQMKSQDRPCGNHSWGMVRVCAKKRSNQSRQGVHLKENNQSRTQGRFENISQDTHTEQVSQNRSSRIHRKLNISSSWTITSSDQGALLQSQMKNKITHTFGSLKNSRLP